MDQDPVGTVCPDRSKSARDRLATALAADDGADTGQHCRNLRLLACANDDDDGVDRGMIGEGGDGMR